MMELEYNNKIYKINEPDIETWSKLMAVQYLTDEREFSVKLLSLTTGLTEEEIENASAEQVIAASNQLSEFIMNESKQFRNEFEFNNKRYKFLDLSNLTFGEFVDLDTYLSKDEGEKKKLLPLFMAMLYREIDEKGEYLPYNSKLLDKRANDFKKLPVKYVNGASTFFLHSEKILRKGMKVSFPFKVRMMTKMIWMLGKLIVSISFGVGLARLSTWRKKISQRLMR